MPVICKKIGSVPSNTKKSIVLVVVSYVCALGLAMPLPAAAQRWKSIATLNGVEGTWKRICVTPKTGGWVKAKPECTYYTQISSGISHACGVTVTGGAKCWGRNWYNTGTGEFSALGDGTMTLSTIPVDVVGLQSGVRSIFAGDSNSCALTTSGAVKCWGYNRIGQLGNDTITNSMAPVDVVGLESGVSSISGGYDNQVCALKNNTPYCWGGGYGKTPMEITSLKAQVAQLSSGRAHVCVVTISGEGLCWGNNQGGLLGDGDTINSWKWTPGKVAIAEKLSSISAGADHTCAVTQSGALYCWGLNDRGQLGDGTTIDHRLPALVSGLSSGVSAVDTMAYQFTCALMTVGTVKCWGSNQDGALGIGNQADFSIPVDVLKLTGVVQLDVGNRNVCAVTRQNVGYCWGFNMVGGVGAGDAKFLYTTPKLVTP